MRPLHILQLLALLLYALSTIVQYRKGALVGRARVTAFVVLGIFTMGFIANSLGW